MDNTANTHELKNPRECASVVRDKTLIVLNNLSKASCENGNEPLMIYHNTFSYFDFVLINNEKKPAEAKIKTGELIKIFANTDYAFHKEMDLRFSPQQNEQNTQSPAYTVKITSGKLKGKTPAQALLEDSQNTKLLENQYNWLKENLDKYPKNKEQMDAIVDASKLYKAKKLTKEKLSKVATQMLLYKSGFRFNYRKQNNDGTYKIKEMQIIWNFNENYPVNIQIENYDAPVIKKEDGTVNVQKSNRKNIQINSMSLTSDEWLEIVYIMKANMRIFEKLVGNGLYTYALKCDKNNRAKYSQQVA